LTHNSTHKQRKAALEAQRFFGRPRLALDAVGGASAARLAEALSDGGELVVYGCLSGAPSALQWHDYVFRGLQVCSARFGF
jgi:trans-2-enoyl-CoA reductase